MKSEKSKLPDRAFVGFLAFLVVLCTWLSAPERVGEAARNGLSLCAQVMIPSLFPFFVLSNLFVLRGYHQYISALLRPVMMPLFGVHANASGALALGAIGGYPIGAATAMRLYDKKELNSAETARILAFCSNAGPGYIFGVIGLGLFENARTGALVYAVHLLSAVLVGIGFHLWSGDVSAPDMCRREKCLNEVSDSFSISVVEAVRSAAGSMLNVCAFLVFFSVMLAFLQTSPFWALPTVLLTHVFKLEPSAAASILDGILELSSGIGHLDAVQNTYEALLSISSFLLGWGGLCVHFQVLSLTGTRPIPMRQYFIGKLLQGALSAILIQLFLRSIFWCSLICGIFIALTVFLSKNKLAKQEKMRYNI